MAGCSSGGTALLLSAAPLLSHQHIARLQNPHRSIQCQQSVWMQAPRAGPFIIMVRKGWPQRSHLLARVAVLERQVLVATQQEQRDEEIIHTASASCR